MESHEGNPQLPIVKKKKRKGKTTVARQLVFQPKETFFLPVERTNSAALHINKGFSTYLNGLEQTKHQDGRVANPVNVFFVFF